MESASFEAIMTGVAVFIFIIALTVAFTLMGNINDLSNLANNAVKSTGNNAIIEVEDNDSNKRIIQGKDILKYCNKKNENNVLRDINDISKYELKVEEPVRTINPINNYCTSNSAIDIVKKKYEMIVNGDIITFRVII